MRWNTPMYVIAHDGSQSSSFTWKEQETKWVWKMLHVCAYQVMSVRSILHVRSNENVHGMRYGVEVICTHIHVNKLTHVYKLKQAIHQHIKKKIKRREKTYLHTLLIDKALGKYACMNTLPVLSSSLSVFVLLWPQDVDQEAASKLESNPFPSVVQSFGKRLSWQHFGKKPSVAEGVDHVVVAPKSGRYWHLWTTILVTWYSALGQPWRSYQGAT